jgi:hypothetical protein
MDWRDWVNRVGMLYGLAELPISRAYQHDADSVNNLLTFANDGTSVVTAFFPNWAGTPASIAINHLFSGFESANQSGATTSIGNLQDSTKATLNSIIARQIYQSDPSIVPDSVRAQGQGAVDDFLNRLADPASTSDQFQGPAKDAYDAIRSMDDHVDQAFSTKNTGQG